MNGETRTTRSVFVWNTGGWFGSQFGCTAWMLPYGAALLFEDSVTAVFCLCGFGLLNLWGTSLWRRRHTLSAYAAMMRWMFAMAASLAVIIAVANARGVVEAKTPFGLVPTRMPSIVILIPLMVMLFFTLQERFSKRVQNSN